jgi:hypothetical protein
MRLNRSGSSALPGQLTVITVDVFFAAMNDYPIGTKVPYTITGIDPSKVSVMTVQSVSSDPGIPLNGTFEISSTRQGYFGVVVSPSQREDVIITIEVEGAKTYLGITPTEPETSTSRSIEFLGYFAAAPTSSRNNVGSSITELTAGQPFYISALASTVDQGDRIDGFLTIESGPDFENRFSTPNIWSPYQVLQKGAAGDRERTETSDASLLRVPGTAIPVPGPAKITLLVGTGTGSPYSNTAIVNVVPPEFPKQIVFFSIEKQRISPYSSVNLTDIETGTYFSILVTGPPNTAFDWTGFGASGTSATDAKGECVFPELQATVNLDRTRQTVTVTWPDGEKITQSVTIGGGPGGYRLPGLGGFSWLR